MSNRETSASMSNFTVNEKTFKDLISEIVGNSGSLIPQPVMIIGEDGSGKTELLKRIYNSETCRGKTKSWIDGRSVFSSEDIISKVAGKGATLVIIDDMDYYLTRSSFDEQFVLRRFLNEEGAPMMIGSVSKVLPALTEYEAPFFEGLKIIYMPPITTEDIRHLFSKGDEARAFALMNLLPSTIKSVETVYNILKLNDISGKDIPILVSMFSEQYRSCYKGLPTNSQHILNAFEPEITSITMPELRIKTGLPTNILTAYLKNLVSMNIVRVDKTIKRNTKYSMRDPLFQLWLAQMIID